MKSLIVRYVKKKGPSRITLTWPNHSLVTEDFIAV